MRTNELVEILARDLKPLPRSGRAITLAALMGAASAGVVFVCAPGWRAAFEQGVGSPRFVLKCILARLLAASSVAAAMELARPDARRAHVVWPLGVASTMLVVSLVREFWLIPASGWQDRLVGTNALHCITFIPILALAQLVGLMAALRFGASSRPGLTGGVAGLAASGMAAVFYAAKSTDDSPLFVATWYPLATVVVAGAGSLISQRSLR